MPEFVTHNANHCLNNNNILSFLLTISLFGKKKGEHKLPLLLMDWSSNPYGVGQVVET